MGISDTISKRKLLSIVNSIYDPIGFTSLATLLSKLLLQEAWRNKLDWDEELPPDMQKRYQRWAKHLDHIERCRIPRKLFYGSFEKFTLHIFTDASAHGLILGEDPEDFVRPTVLPDHPIVRRLIDYIHQKLHHAGVQTTLSHLRERFRIPRGLRVAIKPSDFIQDIKGTEVLDLDIVDAKHLRQRIRYLQNLRYQLRQWFQKEYLPERH
ncbi:uncharacterized protein NPIL_241391 [Nephila pilipes]|uniref:Integrase zinc-binding domain-containing protein n=1 Tax=Nephila pilipes TaxID=299642 RepID=A0A8X6ITS1_NEPPI|nr:uncharacterized protein NPIL_241391 [Nephila pilipes]